MRALKDPCVYCGHGKSYHRSPTKRDPVRRCICNVTRIVMHVSGFQSANAEKPLPANVPTEERQKQK